MLDVMAQAGRVEGRMRKNQRELEELVADAAHGHISIERMKALGAEVAREHQSLQGELAAARARVAAQESEVERRRHRDETRQRLLTAWESLQFEELQAALREVVDRVEVDGPQCRLFLRP
jgi:hypothetical protein